jgi:UDP-N-acetylglucosamine 2-epimerase
MSEIPSKTAPRRGRPKNTPEYIASKSKGPDKPKRRSEYSESIEIHGRFFKALSSLIASGKIRSLYAFCKDHDINRGNFHRMETEPQNHIIPAVYLAFLVNYGIDANWLVTGSGSMTLEEPSKS